MLVSGISLLLLFRVSICELAGMIESRQFESPGWVLADPSRVQEPTMRAAPSPDDISGAMVRQGV